MDNSRYRLSNVSLGLGFYDIHNHDLHSFDPVKDFLNPLLIVF